MDSRESIEGLDHRQLQQEAVEWLVHRDSGDWTSDSQAEFDAWLATSTAHRIAFLRIEAGWEGARRLKALAVGRAEGTVPPPGAWTPSPFFETTRAAASSDSESSHDSSPEPAQPPARRSTKRRWWVAAAASVTFAIGVVGYVLLNAGGDRYSTPVGGIASVPLRDGSQIMLNTRTQVRVDLSPHERRVDLDRGEAFFQVAKDPTRPFVVQAGDKRIVAVGTQFSVRRTGDDVRVVVTEGTVLLETDGAPMHVRSSGAGANLSSATPADIPLTAGSVARARDQDLLVRSEPIPQAEEILSWREGYLTFHDTPLSDALDEFNRYNVHQISAADPQTASMQISGMFRPTNYEAFVRLLQDSYSLKVTTSEDRTVLSKE